MENMIDYCRLTITWVRQLSKKKWDSKQLILPFLWLAFSYCGVAEDISSKYHDALLRVKLEGKTMVIDSLKSHCDDDFSKAVYFYFIAQQNTDSGRYRQSCRYLDSIDVYMPSFSGEDLFSSDILQARGLNNEYQCFYSLAKQFYQNSYAIRKLKFDSQRIRASLNSLGNACLYLCQYDSALFYFTKSLRITDSIGGDNFRADTYLNIGLVHDYLNEPEIAKKYYIKSLEYYKKCNDEFGMAGCYNNLGIIDKNNFALDSALSWYNKALVIYEKVHHLFGQAALTNNIGTVFELRGDYVEAEEYYNKSLVLYQKIESYDGIANGYNSLGSLAVKQKHFDEAAVFFRKSLSIAMKIGAVDRQKESLEGLVSIFEKRKSYDSAFYYQKMVEAATDSLFSVEKSKIAAEMEKKYESEQSQMKIIMLTADNQTKSLQIKRRTLLMIIVLLSALLVLLNGSFLYLRHRKKKQMEIEKLTIRKEKEKEMAIIESKQQQRLRISRDMHDDIGSDLTQMALTSEYLKQSLKTMDADKKAKLDGLASLARKISVSLGDIVWAMNPDYDNLDHFFSYVRSWCYDFFGASSIEFVLDIPDVDETLFIQPETRKNLFLTIKEAMNNAQKYSEATTVSLKIRVINSILSVVISDNGKGLVSQNPSYKGNGLKSMKERIERIGGTFTIIVEDGTKIVISGILLG